MLAVVLAVLSLFVVSNFSHFPTLSFRLMPQSDPHYPCDQNTTQSKDRDTRKEQQEESKREKETSKNASKI